MLDSLVRVQDGSNNNFIIKFSLIFNVINE
jgi:hypothetical protein